MHETEKNWFAIDVEAKASAADAVEDAFAILDALGTEIDRLRKKDDDDVIVTAFFDDEQNVDDVRAAVESSCVNFGISSEQIISITSRNVIQQDWLAEWKRHWRPTVSGRFVIAPPWSDVEQGDGIVIRIDPSMAFGTGTHDTTQLCLTAVSDLYDGQMSFLDVGTGTGILAIAAAKLAAGDVPIFGCDTDVDSVRIARENAAANDVGDRIQFAEGPIGDDTPRYDLVCANLTIDVIEPIVPLLLSKTNKILVMSGILSEQEAQIREALAAENITSPAIAHSGEWISVTVKVPQIH